MDGHFRVVALSLELIYLAALLGCLLVGLWLTILDLGMKEKYKRAIIMVLVAAGGLIATFFVAHLIAFYPTI